VAVTVPNGGTVSVRVFDTYGKMVASLHDGAVLAGTLSLNWNGTDINGALVAPGAYVVRVDGDVNASHMITVVR
jgi:flagellar hook assembly protein FlgD